MIIKISAVLAVAITVMLLMAMTVNPAFAGNQVVDEEKGAVDHVTGSSSLKAKEIEPIDVKMERVKSIVDFDDISLPPDTYQQIINYAGITWDSGLPDFEGGSDGGWWVYNNKSYAEAVSPPNYVFNGWGAKNPGFDFSSIVKFNGAYFMNVEHGDCPSAVRFVGYVSGVPIYYSGWLTLRRTPAYLSANFPGVDRVVVEMDGDGWFAMDDLSVDLSDKPDLEITDIWHEGSKIYYKIKNIGEAKAGSSKTELWVDGISKKTDSVRSLGAGVERTESFRYDWTCTGTSDEIEVCADYKNAVAESNEGNNCKTETLENGGNGDKPDLVITDIWHKGSKIYYKIKNIGEAKAGSSKTELWVDGITKKTDSVRSLGAGVERTESFRYDWTCTGTSDEIEVCADYKNAVAESNEGNNCKTETLENGGNGDKPDLVITDIWHKGSKIYYKIKNIGEAKAGSSKTELWVDGVSKKTDSVRSLGAGAEKTESFRYKWSCSGASGEIWVCADYKNAVVESNEANNCRIETWECINPDLIITDIWYTKSKIYYKIKNIGEAKAGSSKTELWVDGVSKKTDSVRSLGAGAEKTESFRYKWSCSGASDEIWVCADYKNAVVESNEANNCKTVTWRESVYRAVIAGEGFTCPWADNDANDMYKKLLKYSNWKKGNIKLLVSNAKGTEHDCTRTNIRNWISWMASQADADDVSIFFYAGHGGYENDIPPIDEADGLDEHISPEGGGIRDDELEGWMDSIKGKKVVIIDSCFSGGFVKGEGIRTLPGLPYAEITDGFVRDLNKPGYVTLAACDDKESALGVRKLKNGLFTYYVVKGLGGPANADADHDISAEETYNYAKPLVVDYAAGIGGEQHPQMYDGLNPGEQPVVKWS